jgi:hypothetical protein
MMRGKKKITSANPSFTARNEQEHSQTAQPSNEPNQSQQNMNIFNRQGTHRSNNQEAQRGSGTVAETSQSQITMYMISSHRSDSRVIFSGYQGFSQRLSG